MVSFRLKGVSRLAPDPIKFLETKRYKCKKTIQYLFSINVE